MPTIITTLDLSLLKAVETVIIELALEMEPIAHWTRELRKTKHSKIVGLITFKYLNDIIITFYWF